MTPDLSFSKEKKINGSSKDDIMYSPEPIEPEGEGSRLYEPKAIGLS